MSFPGCSLKECWIEGVDRLGLRLVHISNSSCMRYQPQSLCYETQFNSVIVPQQLWQLPQDVSRDLVYLYHGIKNIFHGNIFRSIPLSRVDCIVCFFANLYGSLLRNDLHHITQYDCEAALDTVWSPIHVTETVTHCTHANTPSKHNIAHGSLC